MTGPNPRQPMPGQPSAPMPMPPAGARPQPAPPPYPMSPPPPYPGNGAAPRPVPPPYLPGGAAPTPVPPPYPGAPQPPAYPGGPAPLPAGSYGTAPMPGAPTPLPPGGARPLPAGAGAAPRPVPIPAGGMAGAPTRPLAPDAGMQRVPAIRAQHEEEDPKKLLEQSLRKNLPPLLISLVVHMMIIIVLGLIATGSNVDRAVVTLDAAYVEDGQQMIDPDQTVDLADNSTPEVSAVPMSAIDNPFMKATPVASDTGLSNPFTSATPQMRLPTHLAGRSGGIKGALIGKYGGEGTQNAVALGLAWLAAQQDKNGSWSLQKPYTNGSTNENNQAATAMALLAFQGDGHTHLRKGPYQNTVAFGIKAMLRQQKADGDLFGQGLRDEQLYTHAQCTMALCELLALTQDSALKGAAQKAVKFIVDSQSDEGGWRYTPRQGADVSVTGWMVMALQSAKMADLEVPENTWNGVAQFLDRCTEDGAVYSYLANTNLPTRSMTAEALLCRQYLGWEQNNPKLVEGVKTLLDPQNNGMPSWKDRDHYYWYYATQVMHHMEGEYWQKWNPVMRDLLLKHQVTAGKEKGSWEPLGGEPDLWAQRGAGGRLYVTCLSLYKLEVYYRHMPLYSQLRQKLEAQKAPK